MTTGKFGLAQAARFSLNQVRKFSRITVLKFGAFSLISSVTVLRVSVDEASLEWIRVHDGFTASREIDRSLVSLQGFVVPDELVHLCTFPVFSHEDVISPGQIPLKNISSTIPREM
eukprot:COSAG02_NODE_13_length_57813_cov_14.298276_17_plen_116_part_00